MKQLDREGTYKGRAVAWSVRRISTGSVAIRVEFEVYERRADDGTWRKGSSPARVHGDFFVLKKTGAPNEKIAAMLNETIAWGGTFAETSETPPLDAIVQIDVEGREYNGKRYHNASWIRQENDDRKAGADEALDASAVVALDKKHGAALRKALPAKRPPAAGEDLGGIPF